MPILLHPAKPLTTEAVKGYEPTGTLGNMFEDTIAMARIIASGLLDRHPGLTSCARTWEPRCPTSAADGSPAGRLERGRRTCGRSRATTSAAS